MMTIAISSCDEDTTDIGNSLTYAADKFVIASDTFNVATRSIITDAVLARSSYSYLGRIKDPETGTYITSDYMTQFTILEDEASNIFVPDSRVISLDSDNQPIADSCYIEILINTFMGDSLAAMKLTVAEMGKPVEENKPYYTDFDPEAEGYLREDGLRKNHVYSVADLNESDSVRSKRQKGTLYQTIRIPLNDSYTDKQGNTYNNYGTYLMRQYYSHPEYFKNSLTFTQKVCPGFYFKTTDGLGVMSEIELTRLFVHFRHKSDSVVVADKTVFNGTEEVLQTTHITNDRKMIEILANETECTYLKAPDGIVTEVTLPVDDIKRGHENDTIASAKVIFRSMNEISDYSDLLLQEPKHLLMIERDSLYSFFENRQLPNNITSYLATYSSSKNSYTFNNISGLVNHMYANRNKNVNWNKAVLIPVQITTTSSSSSSSSSTVASVSNEMKVTSVRLVGGSNNRHEPVRISVVYSKQSR